MIRPWKGGSSVKRKYRRKHVYHNEEAKEHYKLTVHDRENGDGG